MSKVVIRITVFLLFISIGLLGYEYYQYSKIEGVNDQKKIQKVEEEINDISLQMEEKKKELDTIKETNSWKVEVYETWKKEINQ